MRYKAALLWDESYIWGVMSYNALRRLGLGFELVRAEDIRKGRLKEFKALFVPGGWASNKIEALGEDGAKRIREFVSSGGSYVGVCGGAGLATMEGLALVDIERKPLKERVPSLSGKVRAELAPHPIWAGIEEPVFTLWWPSQFVVGDSLNAIASFLEATDEAFSSDLNVGDMRPAGWAEAEKAYGLNLDPARMKGEPLVVEGACGRGKVIASLIHFDSPGCRNGERVLKNLWGYLGLERADVMRERPSEPTGELYETARKLHEFGKRNFLWFERGPLVQWRRGIRGLEYFTLYSLVRELSHRDASAGTDIAGKLREFTGKATRLLLLEREALRRGEAMTFSNAPEGEIRALRRELFGDRKSHGGSFKKILAEADGLLYEMLKAEMDKAERRAGGKGMVHVYTGEGKGKTTASAGLALRAASRGLKVLFAQFMKEGGGEADLLSRAGVDVVVFEGVRSPLFHPDAKPEELKLEARKALDVLRQMLPDYDMAVLDEFVTVVSKDIISEEEAMEFIGGKPEGLELVLTGRGAGERLAQRADLVTRMECVKHYYLKGVKARPGVEY